MQIKIIHQEINGRMVPIKLYLPDNAPVPESVGSKPDYAKESKARLIDLAESKGIEVTKRMSKKAIIALLEGAS